MGKKIPHIDFFSITKAAELLGIEDIYMESLLIKGEVRLCVQLIHSFNSSICTLKNSVSMDDLFSAGAANEIGEADYFPHAPVKIKNALDTNLSVFEFDSYDKHVLPIYTIRGFLTGVWHIPAVFVKDILQCSDAVEHDIQYWPLYDERENSNKNLVIVSGFEAWFRKANSNMVICREDIVKLQKSLEGSQGQNTPHGNAVRNQKVRDEVLDFALEMKRKYPEQCKTAPKWAETIDQKAGLKWREGEPPLELGTMLELLRKYNRENK